MRAACKRMEVTAIGIRNFHVYHATNGNDTECTGEIGRCGCVHAEIALLEKVNPRVMVVSHSPCLECAKAIAKSDTRLVIYAVEYRKMDGVHHLRENGIEVQHETRMAQIMLRVEEEIRNRD